MKCALSVLTLLALVGVASATTPDGTVEIFLTNSNVPYGLTRPEKAFDPTGNTVNGVEYHGFDLTDLGAGVPYVLQNPGVDIVTPTTPVSIDPTRGEFAYMWLRIRGGSRSASLQGIHIRWDAAAAIADIAYYEVDDSDDNADVGALRWYNSPFEEADFKKNPQVLVGGRGFQIQAGDPQAQMLRQFYGNETYSGGLPIPSHADSLWLLGAMAFDPAYRGAISAELVWPIYFSGMTPEDPDVPTTLIGAQIVPEPAALVLLTLGGLFMRRR